jgi:ATP-dependent DNA ligase
MRRFLMVPALLLALLAPAAAQFPASHPDNIPMPPHEQVVKEQRVGGPVVIGQAQAQVDPGGKVAIVMAQAVPPTEPTTSFSIGTWIADLLGSLVAIFGTVIGTFVTKWVMAVAKKAGLDATQAMSDKLNSIITNGLHDGAAKLGQDITGKMNVQVKNQVIAQAVTYAQSHAVDTIKDLGGGDMNDPKVVEALQARAAAALSTIGPDAVLAPRAAPPTPAVILVPQPAPMAAPIPPAPIVQASTEPPTSALG